MKLRLGTRWLGRELRFVPETGSTNDDVLALARAGAPHGLALVADTQTAGRGRQGRAWISPPGANLYLSVLLRPQAAAPLLTLAAGVAVAEALNEFGAQASIKWPNDVLIADKKIAGILAESTSRGARIEAVVVGIGVNLNWRTLPPELAAIATSLAVATGKDVDRAAFTERLLGELESWLDLLDKEGAPAITAAWKARSATLGRRVTAGGTALDLDPDGALVVRRDDGTLHRIRSGEIGHAS